MDKRHKKIFVFALAAATATTALALFHQDNPGRLSPRFYLGMPGVLFGLLLGFALQIQELVIPAAVLANAFTYFYAARAILHFTKPKDP